MHKLNVYTVHTCADCVNKQDLLVHNAQSYIVSKSGLKREVCILYIRSHINGPLSSLSCNRFIIDADFTISRVMINGHTFTNCLNLGREPGVWYIWKEYIYSINLLVNVDIQQGVLYKVNLYRDSRPGHDHMAAAQYRVCGLRLALHCLSGS